MHVTKQTGSNKNYYSVNNEILNVTHDRCEGACGICPVEQRVKEKLKDTPRIMIHEKTFK